MQRLNALPETATITALSTQATHSNYRIRHNALVLHDRLNHDDSADVFRAAAPALVRRYPADPTILNTIAERTEQHLGTSLGSIGVELLTQHGPTDPRTHTYRAYSSNATRAAISTHNHSLDELPELTHPLWH